MKRDVNEQCCSVYCCISHLPCFLTVIFVFLGFYRSVEKAAFLARFSKKLSYCIIININIDVQPS